jgi:hypothetical protein
MDPHVEKFQIVIDLHGWRLAQTDYALLKHALRILQSYLPERLGGVRLINEPAVFTTIWRVVKNWMSPVTQSKFAFCGRKCRSALEDVFGADNIPPSLYCSA